MEAKKAYMIISYEKLNIDSKKRLIEFEGEVTEFAPKEVDGKIAYENEDYFLSLVKKSEQTETQTLSFTKEYQFVRYQEDQFIKLYYIIFDDIVLFLSENQ